MGSFVKTPEGFLFVANIYPSIPSVQDSDADKSKKIKVTLGPNRGGSSGGLSDDLYRRCVSAGWEYVSDMEEHLDTYMPNRGSLMNKLTILSKDVRLLAALETVLQASLPDKNQYVPFFDFRCSLVSGDRAHIYAKKTKCVNVLYQHKQIAYVYECFAVGVWGVVAQK